MPYNRREAILAQIEVILGNLPYAPEPFKGVYRNRGRFGPDLRPCVVLLDAGSRKLIDYPKNPRGGNPVGPHLIELNPQIFALLRVRELEKAPEYGPELSAYEFAIVSAIFNDEMLKALVGSNGRIGYGATDTDMKTGSTMEGQLQVTFAIQYVLDPQDLR